MIGRVRLGAGSIRHRVENLLWHTRRGSRWLLLRDLRVLDDYRRSGRVAPFLEFESSTYSQNGEDGILLHIFDLLGVESGTFLEIGAADGEQNCTRGLAERGWVGTWIEGDPSLVEHARSLDVARHLTVLQAMVTPDNVGPLLRDEVPEHLDLLSLDIDSSDYWIMGELLRHRSPSVIVVEVNGEHRFPWAQRTARAQAAPTGWDRSWNYGCSLMAYLSLLEDHAYALIGCDSTGVNAFFVRSDLARRGLTVGTYERYYIPPSHRPGTVGHPRSDPRAAVPTPPMDASQLAAVRLDAVVLVGPERRSGGETVSVVLDVVNGSSSVLASYGATPHYLSYRLLDVHDREVQPGEPPRSMLASAIEPRATRPSAIDVLLPGDPGVYRIVPDLVQEHVAWRPVDGSAPAGVTVTVEAPPRPR